MTRKWGIHTTAIQTGMELEPRDVTPAIHMANTYLFENAAEAAYAFETEGQPIYTRWGNPTTTVLERKIAALENSEAAVATASGMAAVASALYAAVRGGEHIVATTGLYSGTYHLLTEDFPHLGIETTLADAADPARWEEAIRPNTRVFYLESPGNPTLALNNIAALVELARSRGIVTMIDNTFATPYNQRPIELGMDVVIHSATKFLGGHGDAMGGAVASTAEFISRVLRVSIRHLGGCISPFNAWLIARGISTFPLRMERHNQNALAVAEWLEGQPEVAWVRYPWLPSHPQHALARSQMPGGGGGVVVFELKGGVEAGARFLDRVRLCARTVSLGDVRSLITHPASTTHHSLEREARLASGISDGLVRFAVGLEDVEDIIDDLAQAMASQ